MTDTIVDNSSLMDWREGGLSVDDVLRSFKGKSGVRFIGSRGQRHLYPPVLSLGIEDIEMESHDLEVLDNIYLEIYQQNHPREFKKLLSTEGKIIFLGNGLNQIPLLVAERHRKGTYSEVPIVVDVYSYRDLLDDVLQIEKIVQFQPYSKELKNIRAIVSALDAGNLKEVVYKVGSNNLPNELTNADVVINTNGPPPSSSFLEQLSMLRSGGEWYTTYFSVPKLSPEDSKHFNYNEYPSTSGSLVSERIVTKI